MPPGRHLLRDLHHSWSSPLTTCVSTFHLRMPYKVVTELQKERCKLIKEILGKLGTSRLGEVTQKMCFLLPRIYLEDSCLDFPNCSASHTEEGCRILQKTGRCWISLGFWPLATENLCGQAAGPAFKCWTVPQPLLKKRVILHQQVPRTWNTHCHLETWLKVLSTIAVEFFHLIMPAPNISSKLTLIWEAVPWLIRYWDNLPWGDDDSANIMMFLRRGCGHLGENNERLGRIVIRHAKPIWHQQTTPSIRDAFFVPHCLRYYFDTGASDLIIKKEVQLKQGSVAGVLDLVVGKSNNGPFEVAFCAGRF